jgi:hypothetical protein
MEKKTILDFTLLTSLLLASAIIALIYLYIGPYSTPNLSAALNIEMQPGEWVQLNQEPHVVEWDIYEGYEVMVLWYTFARLPEVNISF